VRIDHPLVISARRVRAVEIGPVFSAPGLVVEIAVADGAPAERLPAVITNLDNLPVLPIELLLARDEIA